ncbi:MAG: EcsC family protein [Nitrospira sp. CG24A]|nr:MAG: EcsC family protein [Nitrospira sp. CG24A]
MIAVAVYLPVDHVRRKEGRVNLSYEDQEALRYAKGLLENPGLAAKITGLIGMPIEMALQRLPEKWAQVVNTATKKSLETALQAALLTIDDKSQSNSWEFLHKLAVAATGAGGGALGLLGLPVELPVSTTIMLRSIADIARSEGERLRTPDAKLACLEVFALGGPSKSDDASESAYFLMRGALAKSVSDAARHIAQRGLVEQGAPAIVRFITQLATRFGVNVSEKVAAQAVPIVGAAGGLVINVLFIDHFQEMARGHFIVRRLERTYDPQLVRAEYERL